MLTIDMKGVTKAFGDVFALQSVDLQIAQGERMVVLGCSGAGKTTLLRIVAGLEQLDQGSVHMEDVDVTRTPASQRSVAMVSQDFALYPQLSVRKNLLAGLRRRRLSRQEQDHRVAETLDWFKIPHLESHLPSQLSGGEAQRVAFAKAVIVRPKILLLDEPLSQVDSILKEPLLDLIVRVSNAFGMTTLMVTHDPLTALRLADRVAIVDAGRVIDVGTPATLYDSPNSKVAASLLSPLGMNWLDTAGVTGGVLAKFQPRDENKKRFVGFRPEDVVVKRVASNRVGEASAADPIIPKPGEIAGKTFGIAELPDAIELTAPVSSVQNLGFAKLVLLSLDSHTIRVLCTNDYQPAPTLCGTVSTKHLCWVDE